MELPIENSHIQMITPERENYNIVMDQLNKFIDEFIDFHWEIPADELDEIDDKRQFFCDTLTKHSYCSCNGDWSQCCDNDDYYNAIDWSQCCAGRNL